MGQQARWLDLIGEYQFKIIHRPGSQHRNSDALSRRPHDVEIDPATTAEEQRDSGFEVTEQSSEVCCNCVLPEPPGQAVMSDRTEELFVRADCAVDGTQQDTSTIEESQCFSVGSIAEVGVPSGRSFVCQGSCSAGSDRRPPDREPPSSSKDEDLCCIQQSMSSVELGNCPNAGSVTVVGLPSGADFVRQGTLPADLVEPSPVGEVATEAKEVNVIRQEMSSKHLMSHVSVGSVAEVGVPSGSNGISQGSLSFESVERPPEEDSYRDFVNGIDNEVDVGVKVESVNATSSSSRDIAVTDLSGGKPVRSMERVSMCCASSEAVTDNEANCQVVEAGEMNISTTAAEVELYDLKELRKSQLVDADIAPLIYRLEANEGKPEWKDVQACNETLRVYWSQWDALTIQNGVLYRNFW